MLTEGMCMCMHMQDVCLCTCMRRMDVELTDLA